MKKIIRGLAMGIALIMYGLEEEADTLIEQLTLDKDPILRYGGMYTIGLAYCATANNSAVRRLLHVAVSDTSDDVRRAATTALGFVLFRQPKECPRLLALLSESYNSHVRYGVTLAIGISCAGTALKDAVDLLEPMLSDPIDHVRQGALIATAMVLIQTSPAQEPKVEKFRSLFLEKIGDKHEDVMAKFGAILATGLLDAAGRNATISMTSASGHNNMLGIVGLAVFSHFWYWYPLIHFVSLAFRPTAIIGLNANLEMPKFSFKSNAKPSLFAYPPETKPEEKKSVGKVSTAILSTSAKAQARRKEREAENEMDVDKAKETEKNKEKDKEKDKEKEKEKDKEKEKEKDKEQENESAEAKLAEKPKEPEPPFEILQNPARVTVAQVKYVTFDADERYVPVEKGEISGIIMLKDLKPDQPEELIKPQAVASTQAAASAPAEEQEPEPPAPFNYP